MVTDATEKNKKTPAVLASEGWERRATYGEPRLSELVEMYEELGYEVYLKPFNPDEETSCAECMKVSPEKYETIYTRKSAAAIE